MYQRITYIALGLTLLVLAVNTEKTHAVDPHIPANSINCVDCHALHILVPRGIEQKTLCKSCHNLTDPNTAGLSINDPNMHEVDGGATIVDCGSCHDAHGDHTATNPHAGGTTAPNLSLVRADTAEYITGALEPAIYQTNPDHFAFDTSSALPTDPNEFHGICQSCHTGTSNHTNDGNDVSTGLAADNTHNIGADCVSECHGHEGGFMPSGGGCVDCHNTARDNNDGPPTRRAIVGEFSLTSHHVLGGTVTNEDCIVCHMEEFGLAIHMNNQVELRGPDTGLAITAFTQFSRNRSSDTLESWVVNVQNNLCLKCHDGDGASVSFNPSGSALRPFSSDIGYDVPNVAGQFSGLYHHSVISAGTNPYTIPSSSNGNNITMELPWNQDSTHDQISCFDCHAVTGHGGPNQRNLRDPIDLDTMENTSNPNNLPSGMGATVETFCTRCHRATVYVTGDADSLGSIYEYHGEPGNGNHAASEGNELGCMGCHGGIVDHSGGSVPTNGNHAARGNIHGGNVVWGPGTFSSGLNTDHFILGGWMSGWMLDTDQQSNPIGACGGGDCNHTGRASRSGQDYTR
ncbi:MAG: hypothetical protein FVQ84_08240 [Planctomycetes bacterium]|nr:hypothetical protein [Planctomycetota bacterium]